MTGSSSSSRFGVTSQSHRASLDRKVPRDLETLVLKAIDKEPRARYQSADDLAADLQRFLADEPVLARRIWLTERWVRWVRRNPAVAGLLVAVLAVMVVGGLGFSYWLQEREAGTARLAMALNEAIMLRDQSKSDPEDLVRWRAAREGLKRAGGPGRGPRPRQPTTTGCP